jgi:citrate lyase subunit beta/citryl-CoA lyase
VAKDRLPLARGMVRDYLKASRAGARSQQLWVRINPLSTSDALPDLAAIVGGAPDGIVVPKTTSGADAESLDHYRTALETREGVSRGALVSSRSRPTPRRRCFPLKASRARLRGFTA